MQIVIDIPKDVKNRLAFGVTYENDIRLLCEAIGNGTPIQKGHGDLIDKKEACALIAEGKNGKAYFGTTNKDWEVIDFLKTIPIIIEADTESDE